MKEEWNKLTDREEDILLDWVNQFDQDVISLNEVLERADDFNMDSDSVIGILEEQDIL